MLAKGAIITPNMTEAALMTGLSMDEEPQKLLEALLKETDARCALITGAKMGEGNANIWMEASGGCMHVLEYEPEEGAYPGTGDLCAAVLTGALAKGGDMETAVKKAADFVCFYEKIYILKNI